MNRIPFIFAALVPLAVAAGQGGSLQEKIDVQKLQEDIRATDVIGADVTAQGGESGSVEDLEISSDGRIEAVLVDGLDAGGDAGASVGEPEDQRVSAESEGAMQTDQDPKKVQWSQVSYDEQEDSVTLDSSQGISATGSQQGGSMSMDASGGSMTQSQSQQGMAGAGGSFRASDIVGMEVHLSDAESFGEVEDVLINQQEGKASALLVDSWEGLDKKTYALPVELNDVNREDNTLTYSYSKDEVTGLQEYEDQ